MPQRSACHTMSPLPGLPDEAAKGFQYVWEIAGRVYRMPISCLDRQIAPSAGLHCTAGSGSSQGRTGLDWTIHRTAEWIPLCVNSLLFSGEKVNIEEQSIELNWCFPSGEFLSLLCLFQSPIKSTMTSLYLGRAQRMDGVEMEP